MIASEGYSTIAWAVVLAFAICVLPVLVASLPLWPFAVLAIALLGFVVSFFRDPRRSPPPDPSNTLVVAPADGKVLEVTADHDDLYVRGPVVRVSIFLSPLNVHVNRTPVGGTVEYVRYVPGEYLVAWHPKSSEKNERSEIGVMHASGARILFKQIAGAVARRVVFHLHEGDHLVLGERFGIVKFGSRMDVLVPTNATTSVVAGQRVVAGETVIARLVADTDQ